MKKKEKKTAVVLTTGSSCCTGRVTIKSEIIVGYQRRVPDTTGDESTHSQVLKENSTRGLCFAAFASFSNGA